VLLGSEKVVANAIALHSRRLKPDDLPIIRPDENQ